MDDLGKIRGHLMFVAGWLSASGDLPDETASLLAAARMLRERARVGPVSSRSRKRKLHGIAEKNVKLNEDDIRSIRRLRSDGAAWKWLADKYGVHLCTGSMTLIPEEMHGIMTVRDTDGGRWFPNDEALAQIEAAADQEAEAVKICEAEPMRGQWRD